MAYLTLACLFMIASCSSHDQQHHPTAAEAEATMRTHITKLSSEGVGNIRHVKVVDRGGVDIPCGKGKVRRSYGIQGDKLDPHKDNLSRNQNDLANLLFGTLITQVAKYDPVDPRGGSSRINTYSSTHRTSILINIPEKGIVEISGSTDCLPRDR